MTKLKDKLSANVRKAKAAQQVPAKKPSPERASTKPASTAAAAPAPAPAARPSQRQAPASQARPAGIPESGSALFPSRVWPD